MTGSVVYDLPQILEILPHRPPFLFVDRVVRFRPDVSLSAERDIGPDEPYFTGHFPGKPLMPGVLIVDALAQASGLLWGFSKKERGGGGEDPELFYLASADTKFLSPAVPGETLTLNVDARGSFGPLYLYDVEALVGRRAVARGTLKLAMARGEV